MFNSMLKSTILAVFLVGAYTFSVSQGYIDVSKKDSEIQKLIDEMQSKIDNLEKLSGKPQLSSEISDIKEEIDTIAHSLKADIQISKILSDFSYVSKETGLQMLYFEPQSPINERVYTQVPIKVKLRGTFRQTGNFLYKIATLPYSVVISDLEINGVISKSGYVINETNATFSVYKTVGDI